MNLQGATHCCSVLDYSGLNDGQKSGREIFSEIVRHGAYYRGGSQRSPRYFRMRGGHVSLAQVRAGSSTAGTTGNLDRLKEYIEEHGLGEIVAQEKWHKNPNSGNFIRTAWWSPDAPALAKFLEAEGNETLRNSVKFVSGSGGFPV